MPTKPSPSYGHLQTTKTTTASNDLKTLSSLTDMGGPYAASIWHAEHSVCTDLMLHVMPHSILRLSYTLVMTCLNSGPSVHPPLLHRLQLQFYTMLQCSC